MNDTIRESKYKVGDTVNVLYYINMTEKVLSPDSFTITEVVYDLNKHTSDTHMYVAKNDHEFGLWFESDFVLCNQVE